MKNFTINADEKSLLKVMIENAPQGSSMNIGQVRQAIRVLDIVEAATDSVSLEDSDHSYLLERFNQGSFIRADKMLLVLFDRISTAA